MSGVKQLANGNFLVSFRKEEFSRKHGLVSREWSREVTLRGLLELLRED